MDLLPRYRLTVCVSTHPSRRASSAAAEHRGGSAVPVARTTQRMLYGPGRDYDAGMPVFVRAAAVCLVSSAVALASACGSSAAKSDAGITGRVLIGPTCPVQLPGESCQQPYAAKIRVLGAARQRLATTFRSGTDGRFRVSLSPGRYVLTSVKAGLPRLAPRSVTVRRGTFSKLTLLFDTGIR